MTSKSITEQIERATERLARLKARELVKQERERARERARTRREDAHRKITLGGLVIASEVDQVDPAVLVGCLSKLRGAMTQPNADQVIDHYRRIGLDHLEARTAARDGTKQGR